MCYSGKFSIMDPSIYYYICDEGEELSDLGDFMYGEGSSCKINF